MSSRQNNDEAPEGLKDKHVNVNGKNKGKSGSKSTLDLAKVSIVFY